MWPYSGVFGDWCGDFKATVLEMGLVPKVPDAECTVRSTVLQKQQALPCLAWVLINVCASSSYSSSEPVNEASNRSITCSSIWFLLSQCRSMYEVIVPRWLVSPSSGSTISTGMTRWEKSVTQHGTQIFPVVQWQPLDCWGIRKRSWCSSQQISQKNMVK